MEITFGAMADPISTQLSKQGLKSMNADAQQKDADAITRLAVRGLLPEAQVRAARRRLLKDIARTIR